MSRDLMGWCQELAGRVDRGLPFSGGWASAFRDGRVLCAMVEAQTPGTIDYSYRVDGAGGTSQRSL